MSVAVVWIVLSLIVPIVNGVRGQEVTNDNGTADALEYMMELYNKLYGNSISNGTSDTVHSFTAGREKRINGEIVEIDFHISGIEDSETIVSVHLRLKFDELGTKGIIIISNCNGKEDDESIATIETGGSITSDVDVTNLIRNWKTKLVCLKMKTSPKAEQKKTKHLKKLQKHYYKHSPVLLIYSHDNGNTLTNNIVSIIMEHYQHHKRSTRSIEDNDKATPLPTLQELSKKPCEKFSYYVNFEDINLNKKIIAPKGYHANYCYGRCIFPISQRLSNSLHAKIQSFMSHLGEDIPNVCCSPVQYQPLTVLFYTDDANIVLKHHSNMVVTKCGCI